ncbi:hypothetical protein ABZ568_25645 [Streptomyces olindensis]|uniref:Uncharacterized protein n=1 Tax=Streptomyces olindensis TaxID=358823 RepID=A0ABV2Y0N4_9ACTN
MGIRTLLSRSAPGVGLAPAAPITSVPVFAATASTVRVPTGLAAALHQATAGLRQHLTQGWRPTGPTGTAAGPFGAGPTGAAAGPFGTGPTGTAALRPGIDPSATPGLTGRTPAAPRPGTPAAPGRTPHPWAELARGYLTLVLALLPRPRPAHTTITVFLATTDGFLSERPDCSAPSRRRGRNRRGPEPDATP